MTAKAPPSLQEQGPRLYRDLADWYPLLTPVADYAEEAAFYRRLFEEHCQKPARAVFTNQLSAGLHFVLCWSILAVPV